MNDQELHTLLEKLHEEINQTDNIADEDRALLTHIDGDIRALLERSEEDDEPSSPLDLRQLEDAIQRYEVTHPTLTITLTRLAAILSNAGI